jgi:glycosyltransferase involved in cell wall biosynthesis/GT2 family glycosyltransferase
MKSSPTVSVVIPCFNDGRYLPEALQSVFAQTLQPIEILVVDDGSTDPRTVKLLKTLDRPMVRILHHENRGLSAARNTGMRNAEGKYIYFLDADDVIYPECLATLTRMLENGSGVAATSAIRISGGPDHGTVWGGPYNPYLILVYNQWCAGIMLRGEASKKYDLTYDESMRSGYEDWELNIRLGNTGHEILFSTEPLYQYRIRKKSLLSTTRKFHVEVVNYIRVKHRDQYTIESLLNTKRAHLPALRVSCGQQQFVDLLGWLTRQTFRDWLIDSTGKSGEKKRYCFCFASVDALRRLPSEALECALMALECYGQAHHCVLAVRQGCTSLFATSTPVTGGLEDHRYPVALITRNDSETGKIAPKQALRECDLLVEFIDQNPSSDDAWDRSLVQILPNTLMTGFDGLRSLRKNLRSVGKQVFGDSFQRECVRLYDHIYYRVLRSDAVFGVRNKITSKLGASFERTLSALVYGLFLTQPPSEGERNLTDTRRTFPKRLSPLFASPADERIHLLIATNWLIEGGVEQIIFELCRLLDPSRFRLTIVTTLSSHHSWDRLARNIGASVYHLADFLRPSEMVKGFLHLVVNHHVDCMFIMNSEVAYRAAKTLKRRIPWLPIVDRIEAPDPGGGYPMISAKVGREFIDLRTVSHKKLADYMCKKYRPRLSPPQVIYIGMNMNRIGELSRLKSGLLHEACNVSPDTPVVLFVGRLANQKRPEVFVRSVAKILEIHPASKACFAMVGDGHLFKSVQALVSEHRLAHRIHLLGAHPNALQLLADATILLMPSAYEGVALVSYEAMALGIPQIFANVGGQDELITPETGVLIENGPGEEARYAQACLDLLCDPHRRAYMADAGKERIRLYFTAENAVKQYAEIFEGLAAMSRKRASEIPHLEPPHLDPLHDVL